MSKAKIFSYSLIFKLKIRKIVLQKKKKIKKKQIYRNKKIFLLLNILLI